MRSWNRAAAFVLAAALPFGCAGRAGLEITLEGEDDVSVPPIDTGPPPAAARADKLDLLLVVDNSRNLDAAQGLLVETLPYLLDRLTRPACVNGFGTIVSETASPEEPCPVGVRDFAPVRDIHIGVISTSIGGHGADICSPASTTFDPSANDRARLLTRAASGGAVPTWENKGFLAWDPGQASDPPGDADLGALGAKLAEVVGGVGTKGCGFEAQLESIYRFLVDPEPYLDMTLEGNKAVPSGVDDVLLQQRADFLRPDSVVAVLLLTDEDDCSTRDGGQYFAVNQGTGTDGKPFRMPPARSACASNPNDPCCASCAQPTQVSCLGTEVDPACTKLPTAIEDPLNLRCFDQKRRFGIDFLYPTSRYVDGFTRDVIPNRAGELVKNPLFESGRPRELVFFAGILGVPWQDIAVDPKALATGLLPATELDWSLLLGDPETGEPPADPLMRPSIDPREGIHPRTGIPLAPPSASALENPINGHERTTTARDDLQYACIFPLRVPKECTGQADCECAGTDVTTNPVCQAPDGSYGATQRFARAVPATRPLAVMKELGTQAVVASICAEKVSSPVQPTFAYKPAADALLRTIRRRLEPGG
ncbi:hypothetical protein [Polyangium mundeleinium]|uniref:VWA domain-containing protein n=1 Tax=Polyangium mundeleinium TaxID=2995306 RepID=A0ABT5EIB1_9BACT|nr:hypothetical protein [Polyangium mundeleinium]MDC0741548.1 hypothetical protein [Polyangium mundeleinium]